MDAAANLTRDSAPEVFLAEPVGSCTDLRASVAYPLRRLYGDRFSVAPMSVLVDPIRAARILGLEPGKVFAPKVVYVYRKQLEEADVIVINKADLIDERRVEQLNDALAIEFPRAEIFSISALHSQGLNACSRGFSAALWLPSPPRTSITTCMRKARPCWAGSNATIHLEKPGPFCGNRMLEALASEIQRSLASNGAEIAHLKMTLTPDGDGGDIGAINLVRRGLIAVHVASLSADSNRESSSSTCEP